MKKPTKLKPRTLDITFCERAIRAQCATCARNVKRYDMTSRAFYSVFAAPRKDARRKCDYYLADYRQPKETAK